jgi:aspartate 1-decarboxylase
MLRVVRAKLHGIRVTSTELDYHGSITLDPQLCGKAGIRPLEFVDIFNKSNGARWYTYVIYGEHGSRCCVLNGPSARNCQKGDAVIICASAYIEEEQLYAIKPRVLTFTPSNEIEDTLHYEVTKAPEADFEFKMVLEQSANRVRAVDQIDVAAISADLRKRGLTDHAIADFIACHLKRAR